MKRFTFPSARPCSRFNAVGPTSPSGSKGGQAGSPSVADADKPASNFTLHTILILCAGTTAALWREWIEAEPDLYVVGDTASDSSTLLSRAHHADAVVFNLEEAGSQGYLMTEFLSQLSPETRLLLTARDFEPFGNPPSPLKKLHGVIIGDVSREALVKAIRVTLSGGTYVLIPRQP